MTEAIAAICCRLCRRGWAGHWVPADGAGNGLGGGEGRLGTLVGNGVFDAANASVARMLTSIAIAQNH